MLRWHFKSKSKEQLGIGIGLQSKPEKRSMAWTNGAVQLKPRNGCSLHVSNRTKWGLESGDVSKWIWMTSKVHANY